MAASEDTLLNFSSPLTDLSARVDPLVIFNLCDCYVRRPDQADCVIGTLLGSVLPDGTVDIRKSYAVPHNEFSDQATCCAISRDPFGSKDCGSRKSRELPEWKSEPLIKPALQTLEITFRLVSTVLSDLRSYLNTSEWERRLQSLTTTQLQVVVELIESGEGSAPIAGSSSCGGGGLARGGSTAEVWRLPAGADTVVRRTSEASLLPRLAAWKRSEAAAETIQYAVECVMRRCPYTLGLGEPNLAAKQCLDYDGIVKPQGLRALRQNPYSEQIQNRENQTLYTIHQILESWLQSAAELLNRIGERIESERFEMAASDCFLLESFWKLLTEIEDLLLLMDPADFLRLKSQLDLRSEAAPFCFRSTALVELTQRCRDLRRFVPRILGVEADPTGGPRVQEAAMRLYQEKAAAEKIHILQGLQAVEAAVKRFFYANKQVVEAVMGSLEARDAGESLSRVFLEPTYFPSLDAAKTFLGVSLSRERAPTGN